MNSALIAKYKPLLSTLTLGLIMAALLSCATNPVTGSSDFVMLSEDEEIQMGREAHAEILKKYGEAYDQPHLQAYVQSVGAQVAAHSHRSHLVYHFTVLDSTQVNAFALPGGYIYITRGLLAYLNSEAELAAVLGHEIGHVTARHSVRQISASRAASLGYSIGSIFIPELRTQAMQNLFDLLGGALISGYGRENELEADRLGAEYLARSDYDPQAMIKVIGVLKDQEVFERQLAQEEGREPRIYHGVFASHPRNDKRLNEVVSAAAHFQTAQTTKVAHESYMNMVNAMTYGDSAREGIRRGQRFYHKMLDFALSFPEGWRIENLADAVVAQPPEKNGFLQLQVQDLNKRLSPQEFMTTQLKLTPLKDGAVINPGGLEGYTALVQVKTVYGSRPARFAVIYHHNRAFVFMGASQDALQPRYYDHVILDSIRSFHPLKQDEKKWAEALQLNIIRAAAGATFHALAQSSPLSHHPEEQLRLLNQLYPTGEPQAGQLLKIVQ